METHAINCPAGSARRGDRRLPFGYAGTLPHPTQLRSQIINQRARRRLARAPRRKYRVELDARHTPVGQHAHQRAAGEFGAAAQQAGRQQSQSRHRRRDRALIEVGPDARLDLDRQRLPAALQCQRRLRGTDRPDDDLMSLDIARRLRRAGAAQIGRRRHQHMLIEAEPPRRRFGPVRDSNATARRLGFNEHVLVAAPAYLRRAGTPQAPCDIKGHQIIIGPVGAAQSALTLERGGQSLTVKVEARVRTNLNEGAVAAAVAGLGLLSTGLLSCRAELASGALVRVLPDWSMSGVEFHAVFPAGRASKASARALVDYLAAELSRVG